MEPSVPPRRALDAIFSPKTVAVIGATEADGSVGRAVWENLMPLGDRVFPVHPQRATVMGRPAYPKVGNIPVPVDLAVIVTPAPTVGGIVRECAQAGVSAAVVISAGFKETGEPGARLEREILGEARRGGMRIVGPNCLGVMVPGAGLNATFAASMARQGNLAFISQSGALCTALLDWSLKQEVGFSAFVSVGSMLDVGWGDLINYFGEDPQTRSIVCYMESVGDARSFLSAAREVALTKPIIVLKVGHTDAAARAATSHTGALTGSDAVLDAAFERAGVLRVDTIDELFDMAEVLSKQPRPRGPRLAIITNAGGPGALSTDMLIRSGGQMTTLSEETRKSLDAFLPPHWSHGNPVDILGDASADRYGKAVEQIVRDPGTDGVLVILTPQKMTQCTATAEALIPFARLEGKPILASWMGESAIAEGEAILNRHGIPTYRSPDTAARAFALMWRYSDHLRALYELPYNAADANAKTSLTPVTWALALGDAKSRGDDRSAAEGRVDERRPTNGELAVEGTTSSGAAGHASDGAGARSGFPRVSGESGRDTRGTDRPVLDALRSDRFQVVDGVLARARRTGRTLLTEAEAKEVLVAYGIPTVETRVARSEAEAVSAARHLGFPVVVKLLSETITHKTDVGGVCLNLRTSDAVRRAFRSMRRRILAMGSVHRAGVTGEVFLGVTVQRMVDLRAGYELIVGSSVDPQFGPVVLFGAGGQMVEVFKDNALGLPPLNATLARRLMEHTRIHRALRGVRGRPPAHLPALEDTVVRFSQLAAEQRRIAEIEVNPLLAGESGVLALDARVVLHPESVVDEALPQPAIRPYPTQYMGTWVMQDGTSVTIRPIRPEDEPLMVRFHHTLSEHSVNSRYLGPLELERRIAHERLARHCFIDYDREMALVAEIDPTTRGLAREIIGVGRLRRPRERAESEAAIIVSDRWQRRGLGTELMRRLIQIGKAEGLARITARILPDNHAMRAVGAKVGFTTGE